MVKFALKKKKKEWVFKSRSFNVTPPDPREIEKNMRATRIVYEDRVQNENMLPKNEEDYHHPPVGDHKFGITCS